jgi:hypothetical protein
MQNINKARTAFLTASSSTYGKLKSYALALEEQFGKGWWNIPMKGPLSGNEAKVREAIRIEKGLVKEGAEKRKLSNVYKPWSDVLAYVKGETKKGANPNAPREIHDRLKVELTKCYKAVLAHDDANTKVLAQTNWHIGCALEELGIDLTELNLAQ